MRTIVITGASDGIGAEAARQLSEATVDKDQQLVLIGRSPEKTRRIAEELGAAHHLVDYTSLDSVRVLAATLNEKYGRIDVLANNAGGVFSGPVRTVDGFERTFQVNYLAPFLLTHLLMEKLMSSQANVVFNSSFTSWMMGKIDLHDLSGWGNFSINQAYANSKLAVNIFSEQLHQRYHRQGISTVSFSPGMVATNVVRESGYEPGPRLKKLAAPFLTPLDRAGGRLAYFISGEPGRDWESGKFYGSNLKPGRHTKLSQSPRLSERVWELSSQMLAIRW
ncbi:Ribitol 2-dehydrogenase [Corynebacterium occultum]|uniref:Ribitol 2-dehydrogenase n=2 Tax=Corynebacterium occultum TaxID=2675219 RepID=A0A6B8W7F1_9CORY|nr:Ribitol 2-dehydrogenase [Corynebacterium occultum]